MVQKKKIVKKVTKTVKKRAVITPEAKESARVLIIAGVARKEIAETTGLSLSTLSRLAKEVKEQDDTEFLESLEAYRYDNGFEWINRAYDNPMTLALALVVLAYIISFLLGVVGKLTLGSGIFLTFLAGVVYSLVYHTMIKK
jgi:transcriptional regulator with XRE-family HTH domain